MQDEVLPGIIRIGRYKGMAGDDGSTTSQRTVRSPSANAEARPASDAGLPGCRLAWLAECQRAGAGRPGQSLPIACSIAAHSANRDLPANRGDQAVVPLRSAPT